MPEQIAAPPGRFTALDVMISGSNTVYRGVPFTVVGDWIQQGRLLPTDQARPAGGTEWRPLNQTPLLAPYFPRPVPQRAEDTAEALEPVEMGLGGEEDYEEEVDMVPLIDVSLVLLIFFMMTTSGIMAMSLFNTPAARHAHAIVGSTSLIIGVKYQPGQAPEFFLGDEGTEVMSREKLLQEVRNRVQATGGLRDVIIKADPRTPFKEIQDLTVGLQRQGVRNIRGGVQELPAGAEQ
jgi:biopolymer transport protein ExbD